MDGPSCRAKERAPSEEDKIYATIQVGGRPEIPLAFDRNGHDFVYLKRTASSTDRLMEYRNKSANLLPIFPRDEDQNLRMYVSGSSGSGKSWLVSEMLRAYKRMYPDNRIHVFTALDEPDPAYERYKDELDFNQVILNDAGIRTIAALGGDLSVLSESICVFDDFFRPDDKQATRMINDFKHAIFSRGRHHRIDIISIRHRACDAKESISELTLASYLILFAKTINPNQLANVLKNYVGIDEKEAPALRKLPGRWLMIRKDDPQLVAWKTGVRLLY